MAIYSHIYPHDGTFAQFTCTPAGKVYLHSKTFTFSTGLLQYVFDFKFNNICPMSIEQSNKSKVYIQLFSYNFETKDN